MSHSPRHTRAANRTAETAGEPTWAVCKISCDDLARKREREEVKKKGKEVKKVKREDRQRKDRRKKGRNG